MFSRRHVTGLLLALAGPVPASSQQVPKRELPMRLEAKVALGEVRGRIDHLARKIREVRNEA
jgi:hypothetical protein